MADDRELAARAAAGDQRAAGEIYDRYAPTVIGKVHDARPMVCHCWANARNDTRACLRMGEFTFTKLIEVRISELIARRHLE